MWLIFILKWACVCVRAHGEVQYQTDSFNCVFLSQRRGCGSISSLIYLALPLTNPHNEGDNCAIKAISVSLCVCRTSRRRSRLIMMFSGVWRGIRWRWWRLWGAPRRQYFSSRDWMTWTSAGTTWRPNLPIYGQSHAITSSSSGHVNVKVTWKSSHESLVDPPVCYVVKLSSCVCVCVCHKHSCCICVCHFKG